LATSISIEFRSGWKALLAAFIGIGVSLSSLLYYSIGIWIRPWQEEFGWSRAEIGFGQMLMTVTIVICAPFAGALIDRLGLRRVSIISMLLYSLGIYSFIFIKGSLGFYYFLMIIVTAVGVASTPIAFTRVVNTWFKKHRGLALGLSLTSTGVAAFLIPLFLTPYVADKGWREGYKILFYIIILAVPFVWFLLRDKPIEYTGQTTLKQENSEDLSFHEAWRSPTFWIIATAFFIISLAIVGLIPSYIPLLLDAGLSPSAAGAYASAMGAAVIVGRVITGYLIDRIFAPYVASIVFIMVALGCITLASGGISFAIIAGIALGFGIGAEVDLIGYFTARYFGISNYGAIYGFQYSIFSLGAGISPLATGYIWDVTGNYNLALYIGSGLLLIGSLLMLKFPRFA